MYFGGYDIISVNRQYELIKNVCNTISMSSHLILLTHHVVWKKVDSAIQTQTFENADFANLWFSIDPFRKYLDGVFPLLKTVQNRGVKVIHVSGDLGQEATTFQHKTVESIQYLGSGITSDIRWNEQFPTFGKQDSILVFHHDLIEKSIN